MLFPFQHELFIHSAAERGSVNDMVSVCKRLRIYEHDEWLLVGFDLMIGRVAAGINKMNKKGGDGETEEACLN